MHPVSLIFAIYIYGGERLRTGHRKTKHARHAYYVINAVSFQNILDAEISIG